MVSIHVSDSLIETQIPMPCSVTIRRSTRNTCVCQTRVSEGDATGTARSGVDWIGAVSCRSDPRVGCHCWRFFLRRPGYCGQ